MFISLATIVNLSASKEYISDINYQIVNLLESALCWNTFMDSFLIFWRVIYQFLSFWSLLETAFIILRVINFWQIWTRSSISFYIFWTIKPKKSCLKSVLPSADTSPLPTPPKTLTWFAWSLDNEVKCFCQSWTLYLVFPSLLSRLYPTHTFELK